MNILILNQYALPAGAPGITRHGDLGAALVKVGHTVTVIASGFDYLSREVDRARDGKPSQENYDGVDFYWIKTIPYKKNDGKRILSMLEYSIKAFWKGFILNYRRKPDIIFASSPHLLAGFAGLMLALWFRVPFILEVRDLWPSSLVDLGAVQEGSNVHKVLLGLEKFLYKQSSHIIGVPPLTYKRIDELGIESSKVTHIPNGIVVNTEISTSSVDPMPESLQQIVNTESSRTIIMYTGAHGVANNLGNVLDSLDHLKLNDKQTYENIAVIFIGGGQERTQLIQAARDKQHDHVYFHPQISKSCLKQMLTYADLLLFHLANAKVFEYGISPNKLYDYMEASKPILLSSSSSDNIVEEIDAGLTFAPQDPKALSEAITILVNLPEDERTEMGQRAKSYVLENHNWRKLTNDVESVFLDCISA